MPLCAAVLDRQVSPQGLDIIDHSLAMYGDFSFERFVCDMEQYWRKIPVDVIPEIIVEYRAALSEQQTLSASVIQEQEDSLYSQLIQSLSADDKSMLMKSYVRCGLGEITKGAFLNALLDKAKETGYPLEDYEMLVRARDVYQFFSQVGEQELFLRMHAVVRFNETGVYE